MSTGQPRRPAGTPTGGQWAPAQHAEADIDLGPPEPRAGKAGRGASAKVSGWSGFLAKALEWRQVVDLRPGELVVAHGKAGPVSRVSFHPAGTHDLAPISRDWGVYHVVMDDDDDLWVGPGLVSVYVGDRQARSHETDRALSSDGPDQYRFSQRSPSRHRLSQVPRGAQWQRDALQVRDHPELEARA